MAGRGQDTDVVDPHPSGPRSKPSSLWDVSKLREIIMLAFKDMLGPLREAVRDEVHGTISQGQREQNPRDPDPATKINEFKDDIQRLEGEKLSAIDRCEQFERELAVAKVAIKDRDLKFTQLQRAIIDHGESDAPPMDDEIVKLFNDLNHGITRIVKKYFTRPIRSESSGIPQISWKEFQAWSPENRELWVRERIADDLYDEFFKAKKSFGLEEEQEGMMGKFELMLESSGRVSQDDIVDWRIRTVSCAQKLGSSSGPRKAHDDANEMESDLRPIGPLKRNEQKEAAEAMKAIYNLAFNIAMVFRNNKVSYTWLQRKSPANVREPDREIIGSLAPARKAEQCRQLRIIFGGVAKNVDSDEEKVNLTRSEILVG